jgi:hypothetical protein
MLAFRTILLWLAFIVLLLQVFISFDDNLILGIIFRLSPSAILLLWFLLSIFFKLNLKIDNELTPNWVIKTISILRPLASLSIVCGAIFKIMHLQYGDLMLLLGIGFMAIYSSFLSAYSSHESGENPDIIDDIK